MSLLCQENDEKQQIPGSWGAFFNENKIMDFLRQKKKSEISKINIY